MIINAEDLINEEEVEALGAARRQRNGHRGLATAPHHLDPRCQSVPPDIRQRRKQEFEIRAHPENGERHFGSHREDTHPKLG